MLPADLLVCLLQVLHEDGHHHVHQDELRQQHEHDKVKRSKNLDIIFNDLGIISSYKLRPGLYNSSPDSRPCRHTRP